MTQKPDRLSPDPVPPSSRTDLRLSDTAGDRLVTVIAWVAGLGLIVGLASLTAFGVHLLQRREARLEVREREYISPPLVQIAPPSQETPRPEPGPPVTGPDGLAISNPGWIVPPRPEFPRQAQRANLESGFVQLDCIATADGRIRACDVVTETPAGAGFAQSAVEAAKAARLRPRTVNGEATGGRIRFSTRFSLR